MLYKLSIIIPVYNTEEFVGKCINSCLSQDLALDEYEIIIVDDGSTDNSAQVIKEYSEKNVNIKYFYKENGGVSSARNLAISVSRGEYLIFVDSDDTIKSNALISILQCARNRSNDILFLKSVIKNSDNTLKEIYNFPDNIFGKSFTGLQVFQKKYSKASVCGIVFSREFLDKYNLAFSHKMANAEDSFFMALVFSYAESVSFLDVDFYFVNIRQESASRSWTFTKLISFVRSLNVVDEYIKLKCLKGPQLRILNFFIYRIISNSLYYHSHLEIDRNYWVLRREIINSSCYPIKSFVINSIELKILLLNFSIDIFYFLYILRNLIADFNNKINY